MKTITKILAITFAVVLVGSTDCSGGLLGKLVREASEAVGRGSSRAAREGVETLAEKSAGPLGAKGVRSGAMALRAADDVAGPLVSRFGDDGARALKSLSPSAAGRLAAMSDDLVASGRGADWLKLIAEQGDVVVEWIWERRRGVAVGTMATAILLQPEEFIAASEHIATTSINAAGEHVVRPIVNGVASAIPWVTSLVVAVVIGVWWVLSKERFAGLRRKLLIGGIQALIGGGGRGKR
jgi:hypothetical protein